MEPTFEPRRESVRERPAPASNSAANPSRPIGKLEDTKGSANKTDRTLFSTELADLERITDENLGFSALSDGLGFHQKSRRLGEIRPSNTLNDDEFTPPPAPPVAEVPAEKILKSPVETIALSPGTVLKADLPQLAEEPAPELKPLPRQAPLATLPEAESAPWRKRASAFGVDIAIFAVPLLYVATTTAHGSLSFMASQAGILLFTFSAIFFTYILCCESLGGQTLGKIIFGLVTVEDDKLRKPIGFASALKRTFCFLAACLPLGVSLLPALADRQGRFWHDRVSATMVEQSGDQV